MASFNPSESGEVGASYGSTPGPSSAVGAGGASGAEAASKEDDSSAASDDYPKILLMGLRRSGKSSITKVVFHKMSPSETLFLESTDKIVKEDVANSSFVQFSIWDFPGQIDFVDPTFDSEKVFERCGAIIFVIDAQDDWDDAIAKFTQTVSRANAVNPKIKFEIFIHKVDGLTDDSKFASQAEIVQKAHEGLLEQDLQHLVPLDSSLTSIYDHSIFEAMSKVVQKLIPTLGYIENMLDILKQTARMEKVFIFDVVSKIYVATDSSPVDIQMYEMCCDMVGVMLDVSSIYGYPTENDSNGAIASGSGSAALEGYGDAATAFDHESRSYMQLNNNCTLYLREISNVLAIACIMRTDNLAIQGCIDHNINCLKKWMDGLFRYEQQLNRKKGGNFAPTAASVGATANSYSGRTPDAALGMAELGQQLGAGLNLSGQGAGGGGQ